MHVGAWCPVLSKDPVQLLAIRQVKHPTEGGSAKAKAADSACPVPVSPAWPCRQHVRSESGPAQRGVCRHCSHPVLELAQGMQELFDGGSWVFPHPGDGRM